MFSLNYQIKMKECNLSFGNIQKMVFTLNMVMVIKKTQKSKNSVSLDGCSGNYYFW